MQIVEGMEQKKENGNCTCYSLFLLLLLLGTMTFVAFGYIFLKSSVRTATNAMEFINEMSQAPFSTSIKTMYGFFVDHGYEKKLKYDETKTEQIIEESAKVSKNLNSIKNSMARHIDYIQNSIAFRTSNSYALDMIQSDKNEINDAGRKLLRECRTVESLLYDGVAEQAIGSSRLENLKKIPSESDLEFRIRQGRELEGFRKRITRFLDVIRNTTVQTKILQDESSGFCDLLDRKNKEYKEYYTEATKPKTILHYARKLFTAFCAGASAGAATGAAASAGNPLVAGIGAGAGGTAASTLQVVREFYAHYQNANIADDSVDMLSIISTLQNGNIGLQLFAKTIENSMKNVTLELNEITFDLDNLESDTGHERFIGYISETYKRINIGYVSIFENDEILSMLNANDVSSTIQSIDKLANN